MLFNDTFISRRKLPLSRRLGILRRAKLIAEYWHSIPTEDDIRCTLQLDHKQWEKYKEKYWK